MPYDEIGQGKNSNYTGLNALGGVLDEKHAVERCRLTPVVSHVESAWLQRLILEYIKTDFNIALKCNLRRYMKAELNLRGSGLDFTVVRPGGLSNELPQAVGNLIVRGRAETIVYRCSPRHPPCTVPVLAKSSAS